MHLRVYCFDVLLRGSVELVAGNWYRSLDFILNILRQDIVLRLAFACFFEPPSLTSLTSASSLLFVRACCGNGRSHDCSLETNVGATC